MTTQNDLHLNVQACELKQVLDILRRVVPECEIRAFGSRVNGTPKPYSDLDLVIIGDGMLPIDVRAELAHSFSESDLPWKVDLIDWHSISKEFRDLISKNHLTLQTPYSNKPSK